MNIDENYRLSKRFDQWYSSFDHFPDDVHRNGCANQNGGHFVVFPRTVCSARIGGGNSLVRDYTNCGLVMKLQSGRKSIVSEHYL